MYMTSSYLSKLENHELIIWHVQESRSARPRRWLSWPGITSFPVALELQLVLIVWYGDMFSDRPSLDPLGWVSIFNLSCFASINTHIILC